MNNLVTVEYDNFENKKRVLLKKFISPSIIDKTLGLEDVGIMFSANQEGDNEPIINLFIGHNPCNIGKVKFLIKLDDKDIFSFDALVSDEKGAICDITQEFHKICEANTIEIRLKDDNGHLDMASEQFRVGAHAIYNAIIDETAYVEELQKEEKIEEENNKRADLEKIINKEKYTQRTERIKNRGVNKFFKSEYDKFKQKLEVTYNGELELETLNATMRLIKSKFDFRYVDVAENSPTLIIDLAAISKIELNLKEGELTLLLNDNERLTLNPHENYSEPYFESYHIESNWYALTEEELKTLCDANSIEMRVTNGHEYADISTEDVQLLARRFYNAVIDDMAYTDDLLTQDEREAAERERLRQERLLEEAKEARIRAEKRAEWWAANKRKVGIAILILIGIIVSIVAVKKISDAIAAKHAVAEAYEIIEQGKELVSTYHFDEAKDLYDQAYRMTMDKEVRNTIQEQNDELAKARQAAESEYNNALRRLQILLDADDNEFNQYSNECLDKMIAIHPEAKTTQYFQNMRGK